MSQNSLIFFGGGSTNIWKIPYVSPFLFLKASLTNSVFINTDYGIFHTFCFHSIFPVQTQMTQKEKQNIILKFSDIEKCIFNEITALREENLKFKQFILYFNILLTQSHFWHFSKTIIFFSSKIETLYRKNKSQFFQDFWGKYFMLKN